MMGVVSRRKSEGARKRGEAEGRKDEDIAKEVR